MDYTEDLAKSGQLSDGQGTKNRLESKVNNLLHGFHFLLFFKSIYFLFFTHFEDPERTTRTAITRMLSRIIVRRRQRAPGALLSPAAL